MSPKKAIERLEGLIQKHGLEDALKKSKFKADRETWISGIFALGLAKGSGLRYWIGVNAEDSTPDTFLVNLASKLHIKPLLRVAAITKK